MWSRRPATPQHIMCLRCPNAGRYSIYRAVSPPPATKPAGLQVACVEELEGQVRQLRHQRTAAADPDVIPLLGHS
jgi:hypothetical protein